MNDSRGRTAQMNEKLLCLLLEAKDSGLTVAEASAALYRESTYQSQSKVVMLVSKLRRKGHKVVTVRDRGYSAARYVLKEKNVVQKKATLAIE